MDYSHVFILSFAPGLRNVFYATFVGLDHLSCDFGTFLVTQSTALSVVPQEQLNSVWTY